MVHTAPNARKTDYQTDRKRCLQISISSLRALLLKRVFTIESLVKRFRVSEEHLVKSESFSAQPLLSLAEKERNKKRFDYKRSYKDFDVRSVRSLGIKSSHRKIGKISRIENDICSKRRYC